MKFQCWHCGADIGEFRSPYSRYEECQACNADLHVCLMCRSYDDSMSDACREDRADFVLDKDRANFCDYFKPRMGAHRPRDDRQAREARARLAELFGETAESDDESQASDGNEPSAKAGKEPSATGGKEPSAGQNGKPSPRTDHPTRPETETERALRELQRLLGED